MFRGFILRFCHESIGGVKIGERRINASLSQRFKVDQGDVSSDTLKRQSRGCCCHCSSFTCEKIFGNMR